MIHGMSLIFRYNQTMYVYNQDTGVLKIKTPSGLHELPSGHPALRQVIDKALSLTR